MWPCRLIKSLLHQMSHERPWRTTCDQGQMRWSSCTALGKCPFLLRAMSKARRAKQTFGKRLRPIEQSWSGQFSGAETCMAIKRAAIKQLSSFCDMLFLGLFMDGAYNIWQPKPVHMTKSHRSWVLPSFISLSLCAEPASLSSSVEMSCPCALSFTLGCCAKTRMTCEVD